MENICWRFIIQSKRNYLTQDQYRRWVTYFAPYRKSEPNDITINKPVLLKKMFQVCQEDIGSETEFLNEFGLSKKIFEDVYSTLIEKERTKMKIIL